MSGLQRARSVFMHSIFFFFIADKSPLKETSVLYRAAMVSWQSSAFVTAA